MTMWKLKKLFKIMSVSIVSCGSSAFGDVKTGELILRSPYLVPFSFSEDLSFVNWNKSLGGLLRTIFWRQCNIIGQRQFSPRVRLQGGKSKDFTGRLFLLARTLVAHPVVYELPCITGLVLQATQKRLGEYRRVDFFTANKADYENEDWEEFMIFLNEDTKADQSDFIGSPEVDEKGRSTYAVILV